MESGGGGAFYVYPIFDFAFLTLKVSITLRNSMREFNIHSVETVSKVHQKSSVKIVTYVKRKV